MEKITSLLQKISADAAKVSHLQHLTFQRGEMFSWNHKACAITFNPQDDRCTEHLLHEYGHALLNHASYSRDIELIAMERDAWDKAVEIAPKFGTQIDTKIIESDLDSYRDWLHARSTCPQCAATGVQIAPASYKCLACGGLWRVNQAKNYQLRRYSIN